MKILGLCGQSGAGKTTALEVLAAFGAVVCDCDEVSRHIMSRGTDCAREVAEMFGAEIAGHNGEIDRKALGRIVFFDKNKLAALTDITHRYIKADVFRQIEEAERSGSRLFVLDAPLLFESGLDKHCDVTLAITAEQGIRLSRIMSRDGIDAALAERRFENQISQEELAGLADEVITNNGTKEELAKAVEEFVERKGLLK